MGRSGLLKLLGAFLAGLVIALASAVIYVRIQDRAVSSASAPVEEEAAANPSPAASVQPPQQPAPASAQPPQNRPADTSGVDQSGSNADAGSEAAAPPESADRPSAVSQPASAERPPAKDTSAPPAAPVHRPVSIHPKVQLPKPVTPPPPPVQIVQNTSDPRPPQNPPSYPAVNESPSASSPESIPVAAPPAAPQPHVVELAAGTQLVIRLGEALSTQNNYNGDTFRGTLDQPIVREGFIIAEKGSKVLGRITDSTPAGRVHGVSSLSVTLTEINTTDGQRIHVNTNLVEKRGTTSTGTDAAKIAGGAALGAIIGALGGGGKGAAIGAGAGGAAGTGVVLATRGKPATLPNESMITFQLAEPVTITEKLNH